ncbi:MAG: hypothetical protein LBD59_10895 [Prevotellaceae bacterium]|nr:hypothetical protein [Prevotellaceae bacterium]
METVSVCSKNKPCFAPIFSKKIPDAIELSPFENKNIKIILSENQAVKKIFSQKYCTYKKKQYFCRAFGESKPQAKFIESMVQMVHTMPM